MASLSQFSLVILSLFIYFSFSSALNHHHHHHHHHRRHHHYPTKFSAACRASTDPSKCEAALAKTRHLASMPTPLQAIKSALSLSSQNLKIAMTKVKEIQDMSASENSNLTIGAKGCLEVLNYSAYRINLTAKAIPRGQIKDARAWMSAALSYQHGCRSGFQKFVNVSSKVNRTVPFLDSLMELSSNALSMVLNYDIHGNDTASWGPPKTERDGVWEPPVCGKKLHFQGGIPRNLTVHATVCKDGSCGFRTIQAAVDAAPSNLVGKKFVIWIKTGVYEEIVRVRFEKKNVVLLGDGMGKTIIKASLNVGIPGMTTSDSATVGVAGDGFMASNLTIKNTAGSEAQQAVAFRSDSDLSVIENVEFIGNQDTLYAKSLRQYYKSCRIQGNVDFIFGNAAAFFQDCEILVAPRTSDAEKGEKNAVTAQARTDPAQSTGFVFDNCVINGTKRYMTLYHSKPSVHKNYLGRPWREYSRTVFINCRFEDLVTPEGWMPWSGEFALKTLYYGEFESRGPGANTSRRTNWSNQIPADHVSIYSVENFIQGDEWIPTSYD